VVVAGFSHAEADGLRKVMSKKDREYQLRDYLDRFVAGASERGLTDGQIGEIWRMIMSFNGYSFCKPHSASYARISFQAAYLKTHFPAEFMAAVISNQGGFYSPFAYVSEAKRLGVRVLPPDVIKSDIRWKGDGRIMRVGFLSIKGLSITTQERILSEREKSPFTGMSDFLDRVRPDEAEARALIHSGALDRFHPQRHRAALVWQFCAWQKYRSRSAATLPLFSRSESMTTPDLPTDPDLDRLRREFKVLGFLCELHPMTLFEWQLSTIHRIKAADLASHLNHHIRVAGWLITGKTVMTHNGDPMKFITFEDETGIIESVFFPKAYRSFCHMLDYGLPYLISGKVEANWGVATLTVASVRLLRPVSAPMAV